MVITEVGVTYASSHFSKCFIQSLSHVIDGIIIVVILNFYEAKNDNS